MSRRPADVRAHEEGYSFLELLLVMGVIAMLMGLSMGFIGNIGRSAQSAQAAAILVESGVRCQNRSAGNNRATLEVVRRNDAKDVERLFVVTSTQETVLTAHFEAARKGIPETEWQFASAGSISAAKASGSVRVDPYGKAGSCATFARTGVIDFESRPAFAVTHGLLVEAWVRPTTGTARTVLVGARNPDDEKYLWSVSLVPGGAPDSFQVELLVQVVAESKDGTDAGTAHPLKFTSAGSPVAMNEWSHLQVSFDGRVAGVRVDGIERYTSDAREARGPASYRFVVPAAGVAHLRAGDGTFVGSLDTLTVSGVFRGDEDVRPLPDHVEIQRPSLPIRVVFANGRLDPLIHATDVVIRMTTPRDRQAGTSYKVTYGLYGAIQPAEKAIDVLPDAGAGARAPGTPPVPPQAVPEAPAASVGPGSDR